MAPASRRCCGRCSGIEKISDGSVHFRRPGHHALDAEPAGYERPRAGAGRPPYRDEPDRARKSADGRVQSPPNRNHRPRDRRDLRPLFQSEGAARPLGLGAVGRRAADAGHRPRAAGRAQADDAGRAVAGTEPAALVGGVCANRRTQPRAQHHHLAGRAEYPARARTRELGLCHRAWKGRHRRAAGEAARRQQTCQCLSRPGRRARRWPHNKKPQGYVRKFTQEF